MIIAVTSRGETLDDQVDPRFGRCPYFLVVDSETLKVEPVENPNVALGGGAGIQSAQLMAERDVKVVLTGNCGPNAYQTLNAAGVEVIVGVSGLIRDAVAQFTSGILSTTEGPNVASHHGVGPDAGGAQAGGQAPEGTGVGMGGGTAMGRGMGGGGGGRGMGGGMGGGGGGGRGMGGGMGGGRGMGRGMGGGMGVAPPTGPAEPGFQAPPGGGSEIDALKAQAQELETQLQAITGRIAQIGSGQRRLVAVVSAEVCTACGLCVDVCPVDAITIDTIATINAETCTGCGQCVVGCPRDALTLKKG